MNRIVLKKDEVIKVFEKLDIDISRVKNVKSYELTDIDCQVIVGGLHSDDIKKLPSRILKGLLVLGTNESNDVLDIKLADCYKSLTYKEPIERSLPDEC